ncbi:MAG: tyrosine-type recombinase/integrase [Propionivibrio sp.]|uniref:tyrosine-type recombinase/integrase n=1 Tax=Propionivibrio sp. TaxID=2212460 RepID=UPI0025D430B3|nr:site-specific integrase [Propionivibrio sp.]MBK8892538.1 tyrosine-type recombinase/integrase [Propionivibrio sp.]
MGQLTDVQIQSWIRQNKPVAGSAPQFWRQRARLGYDSRGARSTIGYPDISLAAARKLATKLRAELDTGVDVAAAKRKLKLAQRQAKSFKELSEIYIELAGPQLKVNTLGETKRYLKKDVYPRIGYLPAVEVLEPEVIYLVEQIARRSKSVARRTFEILSVILSFGVSRQIIQRNPCSSIKISSLIAQPRPKRERIMLTEDELKILMPNAISLGEENALMLKVLLATCVRKGELTKAKWVDMDFETGIWRVPSENSKTGKGFDVPLAPTVIGWLNELRGLSKQSDYVLPARKRGYAKKSETISNSTLNAALDRISFGIREFSPHDLRSTARSYLVKQGMSVVAAERSLNHALGGLIGIYDQYDYLDERRSGLEIWAAFLKKCELELAPDQSS